MCVCVFLLEHHLFIIILNCSFNTFTPLTEWQAILFENKKKCLNEFVQQVNLECIFFITKNLECSYNEVY